MDGKTQVLIADDHPVLRSGLRRLLETEGDIEVVGEAGDGIQALEMVAALKPGVLLLDLAMPLKSGIEVLQELQGMGIQIPTILLTAAIDSEVRLEALQFGVRGIVMKDAGPDLILKSIRAVVNGEYWIDRETMMRWAESSLQPRSSKSLLTGREIEIAEQVGAGSGNREIGATLSISEQTVKRHLANIYQKLGISNRVELALYAIRNRIVKLP
jgi:DNA-binding NarL/FixJ family response regulator